MDRRMFLKGLVATAAGILVPTEVAAEPERRVWALDRTMVPWWHEGGSSELIHLAPGTYPLRYIHVLSFDCDLPTEYTFGLEDGREIRSGRMPAFEVEINNTLEFEALPRLLNRAYGPQWMTLSVLA